jgi:hypothetical protein
MLLEKERECRALDIGGALWARRMSPGARRGGIGRINPLVPTSSSRTPPQAVDWSRRAMRRPGHPARLATGNRHHHHSQPVAQRRQTHDHWTR